MFVKTTKSRSHTYLQIVESFREEGKVKHKVLLNLGRLDHLLQNRTLETLGRKFLLLAGQSPDPLSDMTEISRLCYGHIAYQKIWKKIKLDKILNNIASRHPKLALEFTRVVFYLAIHRLLRGGSKLNSFEQREEFKDLDTSDIGLQHLYRSLDVLAEHKEEIEKQMFAQYQSLFNSQVDVAFYDVTTFHFESIIADQLKDFGFSKNGKFNEVQVVMGLFTDQQGRPIGYELFPGNTSDGKTMVAALDKLKQRFCIKQVIIVADKGLNNKKNFHLIRQAGYDYIVSSKIRSMGKDQIDQILCDEDIKDTVVDEQTGEVLFGYKTTDLEVRYRDEHNEEHSWTDQLIISWSAKRALKDQKDRQRHIDKATQMIQAGRIPTTKKGGKRYIRQDVAYKSKPALDEKKIQEDQRWDGVYGIQSSRKDLSRQQITEAYHNLWRIEQSFRVMKTTMKTRPIFHWTPNRIRGHFVLCFIAFAMERYLEDAIIKKGISMSPDRIKSALNKLQVSVLEWSDKRFYVKGSGGKEGAKILRALNIRPLNNIEPIQ